MGDGAIEISASQIKLFKRCPMRWYYNYIEGRKEEAGPAAELGSRVHALCEAWFRDEEYPPTDTLEGKMAIALIGNVPKDDEFRVEEKFAFLHRGIWYRGYMDLKSDTRVIDHKTTSDFKWALTKHTLRRDIQAIIYAMQATHEGREAVSLIWNYVRTKGKVATKPVVIAMTRDEARAAFDKHVHPWGEKIMKAYRRFGAAEEEQG